MKKIILVGLAALLALALITCIDEPSGSQDSKLPFVQYSADGNFVTINLDGYGEAKSGRALSRPIAQEAYNFLEVVFVSGAPATVGDPPPNIARASWEKGKAMSITGVDRGAANTPTPGVDYSVTGRTTTAALGAAVMFVGRKVGSEITLLAVGKIVAVDGVDSAAPVIDPNTKSVTFGLSAFVGSADDSAPSFEATGTSTITASSHTIRGTSYTVTGFSLSATPPAADMNFTAQYKLDGSSTAFTLTQMLAGVIVHLPAPALDPGGWSDGFQLTAPLFKQPSGSQIFFDDYEPALVINGALTVTHGSSLPANIPITFTLEEKKAGVNAFYFNVPVVAITPEDSTTTTIIPANIWSVKPGIDVVNLDTGAGNSVGSTMLLTVGMAPTDDLIIGTR